MAAARRPRGGVARVGRRRVGREPDVSRRLDRQAARGQLPVARHARRYDVAARRGDAGRARRLGPGQGRRQGLPAAGRAPWPRVRSTQERDLPALRAPDGARARPQVRRAGLGVGHVRRSAAPLRPAARLPQDRVARVHGHARPRRPVPTRPPDARSGLRPRGRRIPRELSRRLPEVHGVAGLPRRLRARPRPRPTPRCRGTRRRPSRARARAGSTRSTSGRRSSGQTSRER